MGWIMNLLVGWKAKLAAALSVAAAILLGFWRAYSAGKKAAYNDSNERTLEALREKKHIDDDINHLDGDALDERMRDEGDFRP